MQTNILVLTKEQLRYLYETNKDFDLFYCKVVEASAMVQIFAETRQRLADEFTRHDSIVKEITEKLRVMSEDCLHLLQTKHPKANRFVCDICGNWVPEEKPTFTSG